MSAEQTIPVVDLSAYTSGSAPEQQAFVEKFGDALRDFGFVAVENHGVPTQLIEESYEQFEELFALDDGIKKKYERPEHGRQRGYTSFGVEQAKGHDKPDLKEFWHVGRELPEEHELAGRMPANEWPDEAPELKRTALGLYEAMDVAAQRMLEALAIYLGIERETLPKMAQDGNSVLRVIHYPVCEGFDEPGKMRAAAHEDINLITLLPEATQSGLEIMTRDGEWMPVPSLPGQLIVDSGDMMKRITNDKIRATRHRVVNPQGDPTDRYSMPFFVHPHPDAELAVFEACLEPGEAPKYEPTTADRYLKERLRENKVG